jgi:hypothetical protein
VQPRRPPVVALAAGRRPRFTALARNRADIQAGLTDCRAAVLAAVRTAPSGWSVGFLPSCLAPPPPGSARFQGLSEGRITD